MHYGISTYLVLRFAKIYVDEINQQQKRESIFLRRWMDRAVGGQRGRSDTEGWTKVFKILSQTIGMYYSNTEYICTFVYGTVRRIVRSYASVSVLLYPRRFLSKPKCFWVD